MSALPPKADIGTQSRNVRFVPKADSCSAAKLFDDLVGKWGCAARGTASNRFRRNSGWPGHASERPNGRPTHRAFDPRLTTTFSRGESRRAFRSASACSNSARSSLLSVSKARLLATRESVLWQASTARHQALAAAAASRLISVCSNKTISQLSIAVWWGKEPPRGSRRLSSFAVERTKTSSCCASPFVVPKISIVASTAAARNCRAVRDGDYVVNVAAARIEGSDHVVNASSVRIDGIRCCCMLWRRITMNLLRKGWARKRSHHAKSRYRELRV